MARPLRLDAPLLITVGDGITLSVDELQIADNWGYSEWHLIDENDAIARVAFVVRFDGTDDAGINGVNPTRLVPPQFFGVSQQRPSSANPGAFARYGSIGLNRLGAPISADNQPQTVVLEWTVEWQHPVGDPFILPLTGLTDLGIFE